MIEGLNFKTIATKIVAYLLLMLIVLMLPPASLSFFLPLMCAGVITISSFVFALSRSNAKWYLLYHLGSAMYVFLFGLRCWDISIELSWALIASLLPGLILAALFPYVSKSRSELIYREAMTPQTSLGRLILIVALGAVPVIGVLGATVGRTANFQKGSITPFVMGFILYLVTVSIVHFGFHGYTSGRFERWLENSTHSRR